MPPTTTPTETHYGLCPSTPGTMPGGHQDSQPIPELLRERMLSIIGSSWRTTDAMADAIVRTLEEIERDVFPSLAPQLMTLVLTHLNTTARPTEPQHTGQALADNVITDLIDEESDAASRFLTTIVSCNHQPADAAALMVQCMERKDRDHNIAFLANIIDGGMELGIFPFEPLPADVLVAVNEVPDDVDRDGLDHASTMRVLSKVNQLLMFRERDGWNPEKTGVAVAELLSKLDPNERGTALEELLEKLGTTTTTGITFFRNVSSVPEGKVSLNGQQH